MLGCSEFYRGLLFEETSDLTGGEGGIDSLASLVHPFGARFARPNRLQPICRTLIVYFEGSNAGML